MSLFSIDCESCAARLRVSKESAIGQILACPKCGTMIEIKPPPGWKPETAETKENLQVAPPRPANIGPGFEDVDNVLDTSREAQMEAIRKVRKRPVAAQQASAGIQSPRNQPAKSGPSDSSRAAELDRPVLPTEDWTSAATRQRKKLVTIVAGFLGIILLTVAIVAAVIKFTNSDSTIAQKDIPVDPVENPETKPVQPQPSESTETDKNPHTDKTPTSTDEPGNDDSENDSLAQPPEVPDAPPAVLTDDPNRSQHEAAATQGGNDAVATTNLPTKLEADRTTALPPVASPVSPVTNKPDAAANRTGSSGLSPLSDLESVQSELGELSTLLAQSGTSIFKIQDLAEANRDEQLVGIPKYFVEPPAAEKLDFEKQLSLPCDGVRYEDAPLVTVLRDLSAITGVAFTLDSGSLRAVGAQLNPQVSVDLKDVDFAAVLQSLVEPMGLTVSVFQNRGAVIHASTLGLMVEKRHQLPEFPQTENDAAKQFMAAVQGLVFPQSWIREQSPATIEIHGNELVVTNTDVAHHLIEQLISKIQAAIQLTQNLDNAAARQTLTTKWDSIAARLEQPAGLKRSTDVSLETRLEEIHRATGITVLVDWDNLVPLGWTPHTRLPGHIDEPNVGDTLKQIARAMDLTVRVIDPSTVEITTFEKAARAVDLEVYHFGKILAGPLNEQLALRLIRETLGTQLQSSRVRYVYEPKCQCLVLIAPQSLQRQINSVVQQLESL